MWVRLRTVRQHIAFDKSIDPSNFILGQFRLHILAAIVYVAPMCGLENAASVLHKLEMFMEMFEQQLSLTKLEAMVQGPCRSIFEYGSIPRTGAHPPGILSEQSAIAVASQAWIAFTQRAIRMLSIAISETNL
jgi:hypothetical protein